MAGTELDAKMESHKPVEPDSAAVHELRLACKANDLNRVRELLDGDPIIITDATARLDGTRLNLSLMRLLLEHGADPAVCAR